MAAWPVSEGEDRIYTEEENVRPRSGSILAALAEVPETGPNALALEVREAVGWVRRQLARITLEHEEITKMVSMEDPTRPPDVQTRISTLLCATHDGIAAAMEAYGQIAALVGSGPARGSESGSSVPASPARGTADMGVPDRGDSGAGSNSSTVAGGTELSTAGAGNGVNSATNGGTYAKRVEQPLLMESRRRSSSESRLPPVETDLSVAAHRLRMLLKSFEGRPLQASQIPAMYIARYHTVLDPLALGFARLNQLFKSLGLTITEGGIVSSGERAASSSGSSLALGIVLGSSAGNGVGSSNASSIGAPGGSMGAAGSAGSWPGQGIPGGNNSNSTKVGDDIAQLCTAMDSILPMAGSVPVESLVSQLGEQGIAVSGGAASLLELAPMWGFHVAGDMVAARSIVSDSDSSSQIHA